MSHGKPFMHVFDHSTAFIESLVNAGLCADDFVGRQVGYHSALKLLMTLGGECSFRILRGPEKVLFM